MGRFPYLAICFLVMSLLLETGDPAFAHETIGVVQSAEGSATILREEKVLSAAAGMKLFLDDTLRTGPDGSMGIILRDDSTLSLGPESRLVIRTFLFSPRKGKFGLLARLSRGTMAYFSGLIGKLAPESVRFETPTSSIGIRGTRFVMKAGIPVSR